MRVIQGFGVCQCFLRRVIFVGPFEATVVRLAVHTADYRSLHLSSQLKFSETRIHLFIRPEEGKTSTQHGANDSALSFRVLSTHNKNNDQS